MNMTPKDQRMIGCYLFLFIVFATLCLLTSCLPSTIASLPRSTQTVEKDADSLTDYDVIMPPSHTSTRTVCATTLYVHGAPDTMSAPTRYLSRGEQVTIREWDRQGRGWAMIAPAEWVNAEYLCEGK